MYSFRQEKKVNKNVTSQLPNLENKKINSGHTHTQRCITALFLLKQYTGFIIQP